MAKAVAKAKGKTTAKAMALTKAIAEDMASAMAKAMALASGHGPGHGPWPCPGWQWQSLWPRPRLRPRRWPRPRPNRNQQHLDSGCSWPKPWPWLDQGHGKAMTKVSLREYTLQPIFTFTCSVRRNFLSVMRFFEVGHSWQASMREIKLQRIVVSKRHPVATCVRACMARACMLPLV